MKVPVKKNIANIVTLIAPKMNPYRIRKNPKTRDVVKKIIAVANIVHPEVVKGSEKVIEG